MTPENTPRSTPEIAPDRPGSLEIPEPPTGWQQNLPGFGSRHGRSRPGETGPVEQGVLAQVQALQSDKLLTGMHAGAVALAVRAARDVDQSEGIGAPSGRANLLRVLNEILEALPKPEQRDPGMLDAALQAILDAADDDDEAQLLHGGAEQ